jgi:hypothetical protein
MKIKKFLVKRRHTLLWATIALLCGPGAITLYLMIEMSAPGYR